MASNEIDIYWLRRQFRDKLPEYIYNNSGLHGLSHPALYDGVNLVIDFISEVCGLDFDEIDSVN